MSKWSEAQVILFGISLFACLYVWVNTDVIGDFLSAMRPFINGFILAYLTGILSTKVEKKLGRGFSIFVVYGLFIGALILLLVYIVPILTYNVQLLFKTLPDYLPAQYVVQLEEFIASLNLLEMTPRITGQLLGISGYAMTFTTGVVNGVLTLVVSIYVLLTKDSIFKLCYRIGRVMFSEHRVEMIRKNTIEAHHMFRQFLLTQLLVSLLLGVIAGIGLSLLSVRYGALIGAIVGILNVIPLFGGVVGILLAAGILFLSNTPILALASCVFLLLLQQIDATILTPKLMGNVLALNPIVVILALVLGMTYFGFAGLLFAVPTCAMIQKIIQERVRNVV